MGNQRRTPLIGREETNNNPCEDIQEIKRKKNSLTQNPISIFSWMQNKKKYRLQIKKIISLESKLLVE